jgi:hypothetical protein
VISASFYPIQAPFLTFPLYHHNHTQPYLLPNIITAFFAILGLILMWKYFPETLPKDRSQAMGVEMVERASQHNPLVSIAAIRANNTENNSKNGGYDKEIDKDSSKSVIVAPKFCIVQEDEDEDEDEEAMYADIEQQTQAQDNNTTTTNNNNCEIDSSKAKVNTSSSSNSSSGSISQEDDNSSDKKKKSGTSLSELMALPGVWGVMIVYFVISLNSIVIDEASVKSVCISLCFC